MRFKSTSHLSSSCRLTPGSRPSWSQCCEETCSKTCRLALALLNCIYEAQSSTLCKYIKLPAREPYLLRCGTTISLAHLTLEPNDCLSIGYFIAYHRFSAIVLDGCSIDDAGVEALMTQLKQSAEVQAHSHSMRTLGFCGDQSICHSMRSISKVLQLQTPLL